MPRSLITIVTWCSASGSSVHQSQLLVAERRLVRGSRLTALLRSGNLRGSRMKNTGVLLPTMSQLPRSEEHTSELQSLMRISYAVFCLKKKKQEYNTKQTSK